MTSSLTPDEVSVFWRTLDLDSLQKELDETAIELATRQDHSEVSRKKLVDLSKEFKKQAGEDARKAASPLLKSFQGEVDSLSKRAKAAEAAFLSLYKRIIECPDPVPVLDAAVQWQKKCQKGHDLEMECQNLRETLRQYNDEFAEIKNQEVTIRQLKEKVKQFEDDMQRNVEDEVSEKESQIKKRYEDRERQLNEAGGILSLKLQEAERRAEALQTSLNSAQQELFTVRAHSDDSKDAKNTQLEMLATDVDRANDRADNSEREVVVLKEQLRLMSQVTAEGDDDIPGDEAELRAQLRALEVELTAKDKQMRHLLDELKQLNNTSSQQSKSLLKDKDSLEKELVAKEEALKIIHEKLSGQADYHELKKELSVMKSIEFGLEVGSGESRPLEVLLLEKNKSLQSQLTNAKVSAQSLQDGGVVGEGGSAICVSPLQTMVDSVGALVGDELVRQFMTRSKSKPAIDRVVEESRVDDEALPVETPGTAPPLPLPFAPNEEEREIRIILKSHELFDLEQAVDEGMSRQEAETVATEQLQAIVCDNVAALADTSLHTMQVAAHCRQLLAMYNLGQRLFSKTILNQSQGSLSELLSKPRPWLRLTDRGREAFRKIYAWAVDERAIALLRSLSPKKPHASAGRIERPSDANTTTEQRVADILNQVAKVQASQKKTEQPNKGATHEEEDLQNNLFTDIKLEVEDDDDVVTSEMGLHTLADACAASSNARQSQSRMSSNNRWRHDDIPKEMIFEIYKREMSKLKEQEATLQQQLNRGRPLKTKARTCSPPSRASQSQSPAAPEQAGVQYLSGTSIRNLRTILPPITQSQMDKCSVLDTEALVARVKSFLSVHSISQRLFGEAVLGLSQGSVSDLLARPKPWNMLTQKGREPFIRMQAFLDDEQAVHDLRARRDLLHTPVSLSVETTQSSPKSTPRSGANVDCGSRPTSRVGKVNGSSKCSSATPSGPLQTQKIVDQVRGLLHEHNIGQKLFGEAVLGMSQGTVSELLSKPKPWGSLSLRGREPYSRMQVWLDDDEKIDKLHQYQALKGDNSIPSKPRKRSFDESNGSSPVPSPLPPMFGPPSVKKPRSLINAAQKMALRSAYNRDAYPSSNTIDHLARSLGLGVRTVINWFHNQRMRAKVGAGGSESSKSELTDQPSPPPQGDSWRNQLMHLISSLSGGEEEAVGFSENGESPSENGHCSSENEQEGRQALVEKLQRGLKADLDWNCGVREEALAALQRQCLDNDKTAWEF